MQKDMLQKVEKIFSDQKQQTKRDRQGATAILVMSDMQRRLIAAIRPDGETLMDDDLADMEAAAAVFARLAAHKL